MRTVKPFNITPEQEEKDLQRLRREKLSDQDFRELRGENKDMYVSRKGGAIGRK